MTITHSRGVRGEARSLALIGLAAMLWGTGGAAAKGLLIISGMTPIEIGFYRLAISASTLLVLASVIGNGGSMLLPILHHPARCFGLGLAMGSYQVFYYSAVAKAGVAVATLVAICMAPPIVGAVSYLVFREPLNLRTLCAMVLTLCGTALLIGGPGEFTASRADLAWGAVLALAAAVSYASLVLGSRKLAPQYDAAALVVVAFGTGAVLLLPLALWHGLSSVSGPGASGLLAYLGLVPTALAYVLFFIGVRRSSATATSIVSLLEPLVATILGALIFGERLAALGLVGAVLMLAGLVLLQRGASSRMRETGET